MKKWSFIYTESKENKDLWKAIKCSELTREMLIEGFYKVTIYEPTTRALLKAVDSNYDIVNMMMD